MQESVLATGTIFLRQTKFPCSSLQVFLRALVPVNHGGQDTYISEPWRAEPWLSATYRGWRRRRTRRWRKPREAVRRSVVVLWESAMRALWMSTSQFDIELHRPAHVGSRSRKAYRIRFHQRRDVDDGNGCEMDPLPSV